MSNEDFFIPLSNKLTAFVLPKNEKTAGGLFKPVNAEEPLKGIVRAVGRGIPIVTDAEKYSIVPLECQVGDTIVFPPGVGVEMEVNGENVVLLTEDSVLFRSPAK